MYREALSPYGRTYLSREMDYSIDCFVTFGNPVDVPLVKTALASSLVRNCPRLRSIVVTEDDGRQRWEELPEIDVNNHVIIVPEEEDDDCENDIYVNNYLATLPSSLLQRRDIPTWQVHVLPRRRRSLVLRFHHSLGDCVSLLALLLASCDRAEEHIIVAEDGRKRAARPSLAARMWRTVKAAINTIPGVMEQLMLVQSRREDLMLTVREEGLERLPRKLASLTLSLDDMRAVKSKLGATINDVFVGVVVYGIAKYLEIKSSNENSNDGLLLGVVSVNLRDEGSKELLKLIREGKEVKWGNKTGIFVLPIHLKLCRDDPLIYVKEAKTILDRKKQSFEAQFTSKTNTLMMPLVSQEALGSHCYKMRHNTSLVVSNMVGPSQPITFEKNLITKIGVTLSGLPAAVDVHMISYNGKAFLQILVAEEIIPEPEVLSKCVEEALREMKSEL